MQANKQKTVHPVHMGQFQLSPYQNQDESPADMACCLHDYLNSLQRVFCKNDDESLDSAYALLSPAVAMAETIANRLSYGEKEGDIK